MQFSARNLAVGFVVASSLVACGGGGSSTPPTTSTPAPTSTSSAGATTSPSSSPSPATTNATVSGTVHDYDTNTALAGVSIGIAPNTAGATPAPMATTNSSGLFTITTAPGTYMLYASGGNTAVLHQTITVTTPSTTVSPYPESNLSDMTGFTPTASQTGTNLRLISLSGNTATKYQIAACFSSFNAGRTANSLPTVTLDEYLTEDAIANVQQQYSNNAGNGSTSNSLRDGTVPYSNFSYGSDTSVASGEACSTWDETFDFTESQSGSAIYGAATNPAYVWYGIAFDSNDLVPEGGASGGYGTQIWQQP